MLSTKCDEYNKSTFVPNFNNVSFFFSQILNQKSSQPTPSKSPPQQTTPPNYDETFMSQKHPEELVHKMNEVFNQINNVLNFQTPNFETTTKTDYPTLESTKALPDQLDKPFTIVLYPSDINTSNNQVGKYDYPQ